MKFSGNNVWFAKASVRSVAPIHLIPGSEFDWRFPVELKPLLAHPVVLALEVEARRYMSLQYYYKYLHDIEVTETNVVNRTALAIAYGRSACDFSPEIQAAAFSVVVDEGFHSYAARLFALEVEKVTGVKPMSHGPFNDLTQAIESVKKEFAEDLFSEIDLLATCVSESTFTSDVVDALQIDNCDPGFQRLMKEHLADEGRHYNYFKIVLRRFASCANARQREAAPRIFYMLLERLFKDGEETDFDTKMLVLAGVDPADARDIQRQVQQSKSGVLRVKRAEDLFRSMGFIDQSVVEGRPA